MPLLSCFALFLIKTIYKSHFIAVYYWEWLAQLVSHFVYNTRAIAQRSSFKKVVLKNFAKFTGKHQCQGLFFNKVAGLKPATSSKKRR